MSDCKGCHNLLDEIDDLRQWVEDVDKENYRYKKALEEIANFLPDYFDDVEAQHFAESVPKMVKQALNQTESEGD